MRAGTRQDRAAPAWAPSWWHPRQSSGRRLKARVILPPNRYKTGTPPRSWGQRTLQVKGTQCPDSKPTSTRRAFSPC